MKAPAATSEDALTLGDEQILASAAEVLTEVDSISDSEALELEEDWTNSTSSSSKSNVCMDPYFLSTFDPLSSPGQRSVDDDLTLAALFETVNFSCGDRGVEASLPVDIDSYLHEIDLVRAPSDVVASSVASEAVEWDGPFASHIDPAFWASAWAQTPSRGCRTAPLPVPVASRPPLLSDNGFAALATDDDNDFDDIPDGCGGFSDSCNNDVSSRLRASQSFFGLSTAPIIPGEVGATEHVQVRASSAAVSSSVPSPSTSSDAPVHPAYTSRPRRKPRRSLGDQSLKSVLWYSNEDVASFRRDPGSLLDCASVPEFTWMSASNGAERRAARRAAIDRALTRDRGPLVIPPCRSPRTSPRVRVGSVDQQVFWFFEEPVWVGTDRQMDALAMPTRSAAPLAGILRRARDKPRRPSANAASVASSSSPSVSTGGAGPSSSASLVDQSEVPASESAPRPPTKQRFVKPRQRRVPAASRSLALRDMSSRELLDRVYGVHNETDGPSSTVVVHVQASSAQKLQQCPRERAVADSGATHHLWNKFRDFRTFRRLFGQSVLLPDGTRMAILGIGSIVISMGGKRVLLRNVFLVEGLRVPLFSLRVHRRLPGCGHEANNDGFFVRFPDFELPVNDEIDSYLEYQSVETSDDEILDYIEPTASELSELRLAASQASAAAASGPRRSERLRQRDLQDLASERRVTKNRDRNRRRKLKRRRASRLSSPDDAPPPPPTPGTTAWTDVVSGVHDAEFDEQDTDCEALPLWTYPGKRDPSRYHSAPTVVLARGRRSLPSSWGVGRDRVLAFRRGVEHISGL